MGDIFSPGAFIARLLTSGGDARIVTPPGQDTNIYGASPFPRDVAAYASSTANDISREAFAHLEAVTTGWPRGQAISGDEYARALASLRQRLRALLGLGGDTRIAFAPSGTDLEYIALHLARVRSARPVTNILLGADEVGSGCLLSAEGRSFANETALGRKVRKGSGIGGLECTRVADIPVRGPDNAPLSSIEVASRIDGAVRAANKDGRHALVHVVHGSKTGLVLPDLMAIDALTADHGAGMTLVVDACQARLEAKAVRDYLARGAVVFMTGSKFMGGPPFSGFALIPPAFAGTALLPPGFADIFRRGEWPQAWRTPSELDDSPNPGLLLRLEAAVFEFERFALIPQERRERVIAAFTAAVQRLAAELGAPLVGGAPTDLSFERATLATIDITRMPGSPDFAVAQRWQRVLAARGIRLGQPVKCVRLADGRWGGTLRISLSMPLIVALDRLHDAALAARLAGDTGRIADVLVSAARPIAA